MIIAAAIRNGLPLLDLRLICSEAADFANEIEPSVIGGHKIAVAVTQLLQDYDFAAKRTQAFV